MRRKTIDKEKKMAFKKISKKPASRAHADNKDGACTCGAADCKCGCHRAKKIIAKIVILAAVVLLSAHVAKCMVIHEFRKHGPHMMEMHKGCNGEKKGGFFRRNHGPKGEARPENPAEAK
jgi:hypothetical protein